MGFEDNKRDPDLTKDGFRESSIAEKAEVDFHDKIAQDPEHKKLNLKVKPSQGF